MKYKTVPLTVVIDEAFSDNQIDYEERNLSILKRTASDLYREIATTEQLTHKIVLLETDRHGKFTVPDDFKKIEHVAYRLRKDKNDCTTREKVVEWTQKAYSCLGEEFNVKVDLYGDSCISESCGAAPIVIDVDDMFLRSNPQYNHTTKFGVAHNITDKMEHNRSYLSDKFTLMAYANNNSYFRLQYHVEDCSNLHCIGCEYKYSYDHPHIITDLPKGAEILFSYLGELTDEHGDILIPDEVNTLEAIKEGLLARIWKIKFIETSDRKWEMLWRDADARSTMAIGRARSVLGSPINQELRSFLATTWLKRIRNGSSTGSISGTDPYKNYLKL